MSVRIGELEFVSNSASSTDLVPYKDVSIYKSKIKRKIEKTAKRCLDIIGGIVGILLLIPIIVFLYIAKLITKDKGPLFYIQNRIGKNGKKFKMYKFRSMVVGADEKLQKYLEENKDARDEYKKYKKLKNDPRITKVGAFIRKTSLDEFPQFINVLKGDMSLVGPRPYLEREISDMDYFYKYITSCKPGVTGLWQVSGRSECTFDERMQLDMEYFRKNSLGNDIKILGKTVHNIVKKEGAI